jgi:hypothetical protein
MIARSENLKTINGIARCSRYSFGPNRLHYCGPDANRELANLIEHGEANPELSVLLKQFKTLYPYLQYISRTNNIAEPFDERVVEAYWLGNKLLETNRLENRIRELHRFLTDDLSMKKKVSGKEFEWLEKKIRQGAVPHHSFHVLNIWQMSGHSDKLDEVERMDECLVNSGKVMRVNGPEIVVLTESLSYANGKLFLSEPREKKITRRLETEYEIEQIKPGQIVSFHWSVPCEIVSDAQAKNLKKYILQSIAFANQTI